MNESCAAASSIIWNVTWLIHTRHDSSICAMTHSYVTWPIHMWHDPFICDVTQSYVTWLLHMWHDVFICTANRGHRCVLQPHLSSGMRHDSFICDTTPSYEIFPFICDTTPLHVTWRFHMRSESTSSMTHSCDMTHPYVTWPIHMWRDTFIYDMTFSYAQRVDVVDACRRVLFHLGCDTTHKIIGLFCKRTL